MTFLRLPLVVLLVAIVMVAVASDAAAQFIGEEFQVNSFSTGYQYEPAAAGSSAGNFVVVWQSYPQLGPGAGGDIFGQRFGSDGSPIGGEFQVNSYTTGYQYYPDVAVGPGDAFTVVWTDLDKGDGDGPAILAQRFNSAAAPVGSEFQVNTETAGYQNDARVALDSSGNITVAWWTQPSRTSPNPDGDDSGIFARRFDSSGSALSGDFQVNQLTTGAQSFPDLEYDADDNLVVAWQSSHGADSDIVMRRFSNDGTPMGDDFVIANPSNDGWPRVSIAQSGGFVIVWHNGSPGVPGSRDLDVFAERFNANGTTAGPVFQVNTYTTAAQSYPTVASGGDGRFIVAWDSEKQASRFMDIFASPYGTSGNALASAFKVDAFDDGGQNLPDAAWLGGDRFVVVWQSSEQDGDKQGVFGRILSLGSLPEPDACGDPAAPKGSVTAGDALFVLRTAVSLVSCEPCVCDVNGQSGTTAADALLILRAAVSQPVEFHCPVCG